MACFFLTTCLLILSLRTITTLNNSNLDLSSLSSHMVQLEETVTNLQSQTQVQEQKYSAVLANVLSKLTTTTDTVTALQQEHNSTLIQLYQLQRDHNTTFNELTTVKHQLTDLHGEQSKTLLELASVKGQLRDVQTEQANNSFGLHDLEVQSSSKHDGLKRELEKLQLDVGILQENVSHLHECITNTTVPSIYFEVTARNLSSKQFLSSSLLAFDSVSLNAGGGYIKGSGIFKAPTSGIYFFWTHILIQENRYFSVQLIKEKTIEAKGHSKTGTSASIMYTLQVNKDERVWFKLGNVTNNVLTITRIHSYYGGILLRSN